MMMDDLRANIVAEARRWIGVRFRHAGRTRSGVDCVGFIGAVLGKFLPMDTLPTDYGRRPTGGYAYSQMSRYAERIKREDAGPGDVVQMCYANHPVHFGILTNGGVVHAAAFCRKVVEHSLATNGGGRAVAYWRMNGVPPWHN